jgi:hypothetical protein
MDSMRSPIEHRTAIWCTTTSSLALLVPLLLFALVRPSAAVPPFQEPNLDHFRCYPVLTHQLGLFFLVGLEDQFDRSPAVDQYFTGLALRFCNPVAKTHADRGPGGGQSGHIRDEDHHLTLYGVVPLRSERGLTWRVHIENQFGRQSLTVRDARGLMVPTHKIERGLQPPQGLNHFLCYKASGNELNAVLTLEDQFETMQVVALQPEVFCNPVEKTLPDGTVSPIEDDEAHLVCYEIKPTGGLVFDTVREVQIDNQFVPNPPTQLDVADSEDILCVPSRKNFAIGFPGAFKTP